MHKPLMFSLHHILLLILLLHLYTCTLLSWTRWILYLWVPQLPLRRFWPAWMIFGMSIETTSLMSTQLSDTSRDAMITPIAGMSGLFLFLMHMVSLFWLLALLLVPKLLLQIRLRCIVRSLILPKINILYLTRTFLESRIDPTFLMVTKRRRRGWVIS